MHKEYLSVDIRCVREAGEGAQRGDCAPLAFHLR